MVQVKIWILTEEYNDYNQYGSYFVAAFKDKPTIQQLMKLLGISEKTSAHIINNGGGRTKDYEDQWYVLEEEVLN